jgi:hypothetical protein
MGTAQQMQPRESAPSAAEIEREIQRDPHRGLKDIARVFGVPTSRLFQTMYQAGIRIRQYRVPVVCSCGKCLKHPHPFHLRGALHRKNKSLLTLLKRFMPYREIGKRVGLSGERVRQIAELLSIKPTKADVQAQAFERFKRCQPLLAAAAADFRRKGLRVEPMRFSKHWSRRMLLVNGRRCAVTNATRNCVNGLEYFHIGPCCKDAEFTLRKTPYGWLVLPKDSVTNFPTLVLGRRKLYRAGGPRTNWEKYLEAWHLLTGRSGIA